MLCAAAVAEASAKHSAMSGGACVVMFLSDRVEKLFTPKDAKDAKES